MLLPVLLQDLIQVYIFGIATVDLGGFGLGLLLTLVRLLCLFGGLLWSIRHILQRPRGACDTTHKLGLLFVLVLLIFGHIDSEMTVKMLSRS